MQSVSKGSAARVAQPTRSVETDSAGVAHVSRRVQTMRSNLNRLLTTSLQMMIHPQIQTTSRITVSPQSTQPMQRNVRRLPTVRRTNDARTVGVSSTRFVRATQRVDPELCVSVESADSGAPRTASAEVANHATRRRDAAWPIRHLRLRAPRAATATHVNRALPVSAR